MVEQSKRRIRRGGKGRYKTDVNTFKKCDSWKIYHCNVRGFDSKRFSLKSILEIVQPSVITLGETLYKSNKKLNIEGYLTFNRNIQNEKGRGISTSVCQRDSNHTLKVKDGQENDEYVITRHSQFNPPISIINVYGEQESRTDRKDVEERWLRIEA